MSSTQDNGSATAATLLDSDVQDAFYEQLSQLRGSVLSDRHARFHLPAELKRKLQSTAMAISAPRGDTSQTLSGLTTENGNKVAATDVLEHKGLSQHGSNNVTAYNENRSGHTSQLPGLNPHSSGIDPVLLTKSEDLIRAEIQLKRQRIEKQLKEHGDQKRQSMRRDADAEST